ncbi:MAG: extracellular solute-binding protein [Synergistaceae bacterium]|nr:extracellular solute-binding protein [Synergistaceae bacterium]
MKKIEFRSILASACAVFILMGALSGCTQTQSGSEATTQAVTTTADAQTPATESANSGPSGTITIWSWEDEAIAEAATQFNVKYPNVKIEYTPVGSAEYLQKLQTALSSGTDLPDVASLEIDSRGRLFTLDCWENLESEDYGFDKSLILDYLIPLNTNDKGEFVGIDWQVCVAGIAYKRDLAREHFGTDDHEELGKILSNWDAYVTEGIRIKDATGGKVKMFAGLGDINRIVFNQVTNPIITDNKIEMSAFKNLFEIQAMLRDAGVVGQLDIWSPAWSASFGDSEHIFYPCSTPIPYFIIEQNAPETRGNWGMIVPPNGGFNWGGLSLAISKTSNNKQAAWAFIEWLLLSDEGVKFNDEVTQYPTPLKAKYDDPAYVSAPSEFFGGQDLKDMFFNVLMPSMKVRPLTIYDPGLWDIVGLETADLKSNPNLTAEQALEKAIAEVGSKMPELEIIQ